MIDIPADIVLPAPNISWRRKIKFSNKPPGQMPRIKLVAHADLAASHPKKIFTAS